MVNIRNREGVKPCTFNRKRCMTNKNSTTIRHRMGSKVVETQPISRLCDQTEMVGATSVTERLRIIRGNRVSTPAKCCDKEKIA